MAKAKTLRLAAGSLDDPRSSVWRIVADRRDVYVGSSKAAMGIVKLSLHHSGVWVLAGTQQSGAVFENGNRRAKQWSRPLESVKGVTRGPSIIIPHTTLGVRKLLRGDAGSKVRWYPAPQQQHLVDFSLHFVRPDSAVPWSREAETGVLQLLGGQSLHVVASTRLAPRPFLETVEQLLRDNPVRSAGQFASGNMLWWTQSADELRTPLVVDLPVNVQA